MPFDTKSRDRIYGKKVYGFEGQINRKVGRYKFLDIFKARQVPLPIPNIGISLLVLLLLVVLVVEESHVVIFQKPMEGQYKKMIEIQNPPQKGLITQ